MNTRIAIISLLAVALAASFASCKKSEVFDIRGAWAMVEYFGGAEFRGTMNFSGELTSGTWTDQNNLTGTYAANGFEVSFSFDTATGQAGRVKGSFTGTFSDENYMSGKGEYTYVDQDNEKVGCYWICTR